MHNVFSQGFVAQLERHEGFFARPYLCPAGVGTIGFGTNLEAHPDHIPDSALRGQVRAGALKGQKLVDALRASGMEWDFPTARTAMLDEVFACHHELLQRCPAYAALRSGASASSQARADALLNMAFNMGVTGLLQFKKMLTAVESAYYATAADEMRKSRWYAQVKGRAVELCEQMRTGDYRDAARDVGRSVR